MCLTYRSNLPLLEDGVADVLIVAEGAVHFDLLAELRRVRQARSAEGVQTFPQHGALARVEGSQADATLECLHVRHQVHLVQRHQRLVVCGGAALHFLLVVQRLSTLKTIHKSDFWGVLC
jgi:hypothetical protein